jgi:hypothetical protein
VNSGGGNSHGFIGVGVTSGGVGKGTRLLY